MSKARRLPSWTISLLEPRGTAGPALPRWFAAIDWLVLFLYTAIVAIAIRHHLPSVDEAQAWLIARDSTLHNLLLRQLHYEGAPALWPLILFVASRLQLPYSCLSWLSGFSALAGVVVLVRCSPFPAVFRWLLPFTFFLQYQYAVIARPYALFALLVFVLCLLYPLAKPRPILFAVVAGLLANLSFHAAVFACTISLLYLFELYRSPRDHAIPRAQIATALGIFAVFALCSAAVAFPAPDVVLAGNSGKAFAVSNGLLNRIVPPESLPPGAPALDAPIDFASLNAATTPQPAKKPSLLTTLAVKTILFSANALCFPIARSNLLALTVLISFFFWLFLRRSLLLIVPLLITVLFSVQLFLLEHHTGQFLIILIATAWLALNRPQSRTSSTSVTSAILTASALLAVILQIGWSIQVIRFESGHAHDPGRDTQAFLAREYPGRRIAGFAYESVSTQPYAAHNLFFNQPSAFWHWSAPVYVDRRRSEVLAERPDVVVVGDLITGDESMYNQWGAFAPSGKRPYLPMLQYWQNHGFRLRQSFCGERMVRAGLTDTFCERVLERDPSRPE